MTKTRFIWYFVTCWALTYLLSFFRYGAAFGVFSLAMSSGLNVNADMLSSIGNLFTILNIAIFIAMSLVANSWGKLIGKTWLVSLPIIGGIFDELVPVPLLTTILCFTTFLIGVLSEHKNPINRQYSDKDEYRIWRSGNHIDLPYSRASSSPSSNQYKSSASKIHSSSPSFPKQRMVLDDDGYQIFLVDKYKVTKHNVFQKYVYNEKFYEDLNNLIIELDIIERNSIGNDERIIRNSIDPKLSIEQEKSDEKTSNSLMSDLRFNDRDYPKVITQMKLESNQVKQETYGGKVITLEGSKYKVNDVIQRFSSIDDAKNYIDAIGSEYNLAKNSAREYKKNGDQAGKFMLVIGLSILVFVIYYAINFNTLITLITPKTSKAQFKIPDGSSYTCQNKNASQMLLQLRYSRTSTELASIVIHAPTGRIEQISTWLFYVPKDVGKEEIYNYRNQKINSTSLTIFPKSSKVILNGESGYIEFVNCLMVGPNGK